MDVNKLKEMWDEGVSSQDMANYFKISVPYIYKLCIQFDKTIRNHNLLKHKLFSSRNMEMYEKYLNKEGLSNIALEYNMSIDGVGRIVRKIRKLLDGGGKREVKINKIDVNKLKEMWDEGVLVDSIHRYFRVNYNQLKDLLREFSTKNRDRNILLGRSFKDRNIQIYERRMNGEKIAVLAEEYDLSLNQIHIIIRNVKEVLNGRD